MLLTALSTRLKAVKPDDQNQLINAGYLICDERILSTYVFSNYGAAMKKNPDLLTPPPFLPHLLREKVLLPKPLHSCFSVPGACGRDSFSVVNVAKPVTP